MHTAVSRVVFELLPLESRTMLCVDSALHLPHDLGTFPSIETSALVADRTVASVSAAGAVSSATSPLSSLPQLNSNPGVHAKLFLDFDGDYTSRWGTFYRPGTTPAFDQDGDATTFSDGEIATITDIWQRVAEKYSPFNINVTTVDPGNLNNKETLKVVIGGDGLWIDGNLYGGVAYVGGFYNSNSNVVFVFSNNLANGHAKYTAEAAAHESGHGFGLQHQSEYSGTTKTDEYNDGTGSGPGSKAPIMGVSYYAERGLWWNGPSAISSTSIQNDMAVITNTSNGFGYRPDDHGGSTSTATALSVSGSSVSGSGRIERTTDADYFAFTSDAGAVSFTLGTVSNGPTLDAKIELRTSGGTLLATADAAVLGETLNYNLISPGTYHLVVRSHGSYGDVGQYTISGTVPSPTNFVAAPSALAATAVSSSQVDLTWADNSGNETNFKVERKTGSGGTWGEIAVLGANATGYSDTSAAANTTYYYRVYATDGTINSAYSNEAPATTPAVLAIPATPSNLSASIVAKNKVKLTFTDNADNESNFRIEYTTGDPGVESNWTLFANVGGNGSSVGGTISYTSGKLSNGAYHFRVKAENTAGRSAASNTASATIGSAAAKGAPVAIFSHTPITSIFDDDRRDDPGVLSRLGLH